jgi:NADH dehydrogenase
LTTKVLILGGGFSGFFTARHLKKLLKNKVSVELINRENYFVFQPLLPEVAGGSISAQNAVSPLRFLIRDIKIRKAEVESIDTEAQTVTIFQGVQRRPTHLAYDHLVIALGSDSDLSRTPGLQEHALTMKTLDDARKLRAHVIERLEHADITQLPEVKEGALTFTVIGGGFSGIETVGEIKDLIDRSLKYYPNINASEIRVVLLEFAERVLSEMPASLASYAVEKLKKRGVELHLGVGVSECTGTQLVTTNGEVINTRTIIATIGNSPSPVITKFPIAQENGRILVDRTLKVKDTINIWSIGDCATIPLNEKPKSRDDFAPPTAQFAVREAKRLAQNIKAEFENKPLKPFQYNSKGALASLGAGRGVAEIFGVKLTGRLAWLIWRAYYILFLPGLATKISVLWNWIMDSMSPRSVVQLYSEKTPEARYVHYRAGDRVYEIGSKSDGVYTIISGKIKITGIDSKTGKEKSRSLIAGDHFGERLLIGATRRVATAVAEENTKVLVFSQQEFLKFAEGLPFFKKYFEDHMKASGLDKDKVL